MGCGHRDTTENCIIRRRRRRSQAGGRHNTFLFFWRVDLLYGADWEQSKGQSCTDGQNKKKSFFLSQYRRNQKKKRFVPARPSVTYRYCVMTKPVESNFCCRPCRSSASFLLYIINMYTVRGIYSLFFFGWTCVKEIANSFLSLHHCCLVIAH